VHFQLHGIAVLRAHHLSQMVRIAVEVPGSVLLPASSDEGRLPDEPGWLRIWDSVCAEPWASRVEMPGPGSESHEAGKLFTRKGLDILGAG
jgi:hypothetical protein